MIATPLLHGLKRLLPEVHITVLGTPLAGEVLRHNPWVNELITGPNPASDIAGTLRNGLRALAFARRPYDWLITTEGVRHQQLTSLYTFCLPALRRSGFASQAIARAYDHPVAFDRHASMIANNSRTLGPFGRSDERAEPEMYIGPDARERVRRRLAVAGFSPDRPLAVLAPQTSERQPTRWLDEGWAEVADRLAAERGMGIVFTGTAAARQWLEAVRGRMRAPSLSLAGETCVETLAALLALADVAVVPDSGTLHLARGVGVPVVLVGSAWQAPHHWLPVGVPTCTILQQPDLPCAPCYKSVCATRECLAAVDGAAVTEAVFSLLDRFPASARR